jgi:peptide/nickel transport system substrate-binding protein
VLQPTGTATTAKLPLVASQLLREAGFNVEVQSMDYNTWQARRAKKDGWNIFLSGFSVVTNPVFSMPLSAACYPKAFPGWPCDPELERLRGAFAFAANEQERKTLAEQAQVRAMEIASFVPLGEYRIASAARKNVKGFLQARVPVFWNLEKE